MKVAIQGCGHGDLNAIYSALATLERSTKTKADLLLVCGDFQAIRHEKDLNSLACPPKYRKMGDFNDYFTGKRVAPLPTLFIGGNHEASNHLWELYHGGWVAPNIYFLGFSGVIRFGGLRIGGISGIYDPHHYKLGYYERAPYDEESKRSIYHTRQFEVFKLSKIKKPLDIFISHEWPLRIYEHGDLKGLLRCKPYFREDIKGKGIGAAPLAELLEKLQPKHWFSAHMHVEFSAKVRHSSSGNTTQFLALDKCLPGRRHLRIIDIEVPPNAQDDGDDSKEEGQEVKATMKAAAATPPLTFEYDSEWLSIIKTVNEHFNLTKSSTKLPPLTIDDDDKLGENLAFVKAIRSKQQPGLKMVPLTFSKPSDIPGKRTTLLQTAAFCKSLQVQDYWNENPKVSKPSSSSSSKSSMVVINEDEVVLE